MTILFDASSNFATEDSTGKNGITINKVASLAGVTHPAILLHIEKIKKKGKTSNIFADFIINPSLIYWSQDQQWLNGKSVMLSSRFTWAILCYYANSTPSGAGKRTTEEAINNLMAIGQLGMDAYIYDKTGFQNFKGDRTSIVSIDKSVASYEARIQEIEARRVEQVQAWKDSFQEFGKKCHDQLDDYGHKMLHWQEQYIMIREEYEKLLKEGKDQGRVYEGFGQGIAAEMDKKKLMIYLNTPTRDMISQTALNTLLLASIWTEVGFINQLIEHYTPEAWMGLINFKPLEADPDNYDHWLECETVWQHIPRTIGRLDTLLTEVSRTISPLAGEGDNPELDNILELLEPYIRDNQGKASKIPQLLEALKKVHHDQCDRTELGFTDWAHKSPQESGEQFYRRMMKVIEERDKEEELVLAAKKEAEEADIEQRMAEAEERKIRAGIMAEDP
jgi:hypothetical protein